MELTPIEQMALEIIDEIQSMKHHGGKAPDYATLIEIENSFRVELKEAINSLVRKGRVEWNKNVNGIPLFGIKE